MIQIVEETFMKFLETLIEKKEKRNLTKSE
jgi:hypothetical protein